MSAGPLKLKIEIVAGDWPQIVHFLNRLCNDLYKRPNRYYSISSVYGSAECKLVAARKRKTKGGGNE